MEGCVPPAAPVCIVNELIVLMKKQSMSESLIKFNIPKLLTNIHVALDKMLFFNLNAKY